MNAEQRAFIKLEMDRRARETIGLPVVGAETAVAVRLDEQRRKRGRRHRRTCESCRRRFTATRRGARFCSVACRMRAYRKRRVA